MSRHPGATPSIHASPLAFAALATLLSCSALGQTAPSPAAPPADAAPAAPPLKLIGTDRDDSLLGGAGDDLLVGGGGADRVFGGAGDDVLLIRGACEVARGDVLDGGPGFDVVESPLSQAALIEHGVELRDIEYVHVIEPRGGACGRPSPHAGLAAHASDEGRAALRRLLNGGHRVEPSPDARSISAFVEVGSPERADTQFGPDSREAKETLRALRRDAPALGFTVDTPPSADGPLGFDSGIGEQVVRYTCCPGVMLRAAPDTDAAAVAELGPSMLVVVDDIAPSTYLGAAYDHAEACFTDGVGCQALPDLLADVSDINYFARVQVPALSVTGYVPLAALFVRPLQLEQTALVAELGYGRMAGLLGDLVDGAFHPEGCQTAEPFDWISGPAVLDQTRGIAYDCDAPGDKANHCETCAELTDPNHENGCEACHTACTAGEYGPDTDHKSCVAICEGACLLDPPLDQPYGMCHSSRYVPAGQSGTLTNGDDYRCGEYPFGTTHVDREVDPDIKELLRFTFWEHVHVVRMKRLHHQRPRTFTAYDLTARDVVTRHLGAGLGAANVRIGLLPKAPGLHYQVCAYLPGVEVIGPDVDYAFETNVATAFIDRIDFGTLTIDGLDVCATGEVSIGPGLQPVVNWTDITRFEPHGLDLSAQLHFTPLAWISLGLVAPIVAAIGPGVGELAMTALAHAMVGIELFDTVLALTDIEQWAWDSVVPETFKAEVIHGVLVEQLNAATADALASGPTDIQPYLDTVCAALLPETDEGHPLHYFYAFLRMHCDAMVANPGLVPFAPNPASADAGCYSIVAGVAPTAADSAWWGEFAGQRWADADGPADTGCRIGFEAHGALDAAVAPVLQCALARTNLWFNRQEGGSLIGALTAACSPAGLDGLMDLYGTGQDLFDLLELAADDLDLEYTP